MVLNIDDNKNQHITIISEGSCELCITGKNYIKKYFHIENSYFIVQYYWLYCVFDQINAALVSRRDFQKHKSYWNKEIGINYLFFYNILIL